MKNPPANVGDANSIPGSLGSPGGGNGNPLRYSCLGNPTNRGDEWATVHRVTKESDTTEHTRYSREEAEKKDDVPFMMVLKHVRRKQ